MLIDRDEARMMDEELVRIARDQTVVRLAIGDGLVALANGWQEQRRVGVRGAQRLGGRAMLLELSLDDRLDPSRCTRVPRATRGVRAVPR